MRLIDADALIEIMVERKRPEDGADSSKERCCRPCYKSADSYCSDGEREGE